MVLTSDPYVTDNLCANDRMQVSARQCCNYASVGRATSHCLCVWVYVSLPKYFSMLIKLIISAEASKTRYLLRNFMLHLFDVLPKLNCCGPLVFTSFRGFLKASLLLSSSGIFYNMADE